MGRIRAVTEYDEVEPTCTTVRTIDPVMNHSECKTFVPILTVLVEYGNAPFLWLVDKPDQGGVGPNCCDGTYWDESFPMSEGLWRKFADWAIEFDRTSFYSDDFDASDWDWVAFHTRGLQLTRWLKEEVGDAYRVIYYNPSQTRIIALTNAWRSLPMERCHRYRPCATHCANRLASASTSFQAGKPAQIVVRWILQSITGTRTEAGHQAGARPRTVLSH